MKKTILTVVTGSLLATTFSPLAVSASSLDDPSNNGIVDGVTEDVVVDEATESDQLKYDLFLAEIEPYMYKTFQGTIEIGEHPEDIAYTYANEIEQLKEQLAPLNQKVIDGSLLVTDDLAYVPVMQLFASNNGATIYWWGYQYVFNKSQANNFANKMDDLAFGTISVGSFASLFGLGKISTPLGALGSAYYKQLAKKVRQKTTSKGVIIKVTHVAVFTVTSR